MLSLKTFKGGVHPPENKELSEDKAVADLGLPSRVVLPLQQHIGAPVEALVAKGDEVLAGQMIGKPSGFVSVPLHATVSGKVKVVDQFSHPAGLPMLSVVIESDGEDKWVDDLVSRSQEEIDKLSGDEIKKIILDAGIVGLGGAAFPTHVKLSPPADKKIDTFILNGAECEPYLTTDYRQMMERGEDMVSGIKLLLRVLGCKDAYIAIENNKPKAIEALDKIVADQGGIEVSPLKTKYPQGGEKQLIQAITGREVPSGGLPMDVGCVVQNVSTVLAVYDAVTAGKPLHEKVVTVTGTACKKPGNYRVRIGTTVQELIEMVEGEIPENLGKAVMGGPMMGLSLPSLDVPILKSTNGLLLLAEPVPLTKHLPCIRCGSCVDACPINLIPCDLALAAENSRWDICRSYNVKDCIECGSCSYTCPAGRNLVQLIRFGKYTVMNEDRAKK